MRAALVLSLNCLKRAATGSLISLLVESDHASRSFEQCFKKGVRRFDARVYVLANGYDLENKAAISGTRGEGRV